MKVFKYNQSKKKYRMITKNILNCTRLYKIVTSVTKEMLLVISPIINEMLLDVPPEHCFGIAIVVSADYWAHKCLIFPYLHPL